jgi:O-antigen/teichoic acid export membrane protein
MTDRPFRIEWFVYSQTLAYLMTAIVALIIVLARSGFSAAEIRMDKMKQILRYSYPFAVLILLMSFYYRIDSVMLERLLANGKEQAGIYAQSFRILDAATMFAFLFSGLLLPIFSRMLKKKKPVGEMVHLSYTLIFIPAILLAVLSVFYRTEILDWLYTEHIAASSSIFPLLMTGFIAISTTYIFGTLLTANGNLRELNLLASSAVILNMVLNLVFIPRWQAYGAALSSLITQVYMAASQVIISMRKLQLPVNYPYLLLLLLYSAGIILAGWLLKQYISNWFISVIVFCLSGVLIAFMIRLLKFKMLMILFFTKEPDA